jgi:hypothetical protein
MALDNKITVKFVPDGDKRLIKAIEKLDSVHRKLTDAQHNLVESSKRAHRLNNQHIIAYKRYTEAVKKQNKETEKEIRSQQQRNKQISTLRRSLKELGADFQKAGISSKTHTDAIKGSRLALAKMDIQTKKYIARMKQQEAGIFGLVGSNRLLGGSFAVLRSKLLLVSFAGTLVASTIGRLTRQFGIQQDAERDLSTQLGHTNKELLEQASALQNITTHGDESLLMIMRFASTLGIQEQNLVKVTRASIGLSEAYGLDLRQSTRMLALATSGNTEMLNRYIPELRNAKTESEKLAIVSAKVTEGFKLHLERTGSLNFALDQMSNSVGDVGEKIGKVLAPLVIFSADKIKEFSNSFDDAKVNRYTFVLGSMGIAFATLRAKAIVASIAVNGFTASLTKTGFGALVVVAGILAEKLLAMAGAFETAEEGVEEFNKTQKTANKLTKEQIDNIEALVKLSENRKKSIDDEIASLLIQEAELRGISAINLMEMQLGFEFVEQNRKKIESLIESRKRVKELKEEQKDAIKEEQFERKEKIKLQKEIEDIQKSIDKDTKEQNKKRIEEQKKQDAFERNEKIKLAEEIAKIEEEIRKDEEKSKKDAEGFSRNQKQKVAEDLKAIEIEILEDEKEANRKRKEEQEKQSEFERNEKIKLAEEIAKIEAEIKRDEIKRLRELSDARKVIFQDDLNFQMQQVELEAQRYRQLLESAEERDAIDAWEKKTKRERAIANLEEESAIFNAGLDSYDAFVQGIMDKDMNMLDTREAVLNAFKESAIKFMAEMIKEKIKQAIADAVIRQTAEKTAVLSAQKTGTQLLQAYLPSAIASATASFGASAIAGGLAMQSAYASFMGLSKFEQGGLVGGRSHSQGGTIIEAEKGEFVMSRNAVDSIGLEALSQMNQTGSAGITINIQGNMIGNEEFVRDTLIPEIDKTVNRGLA